MKALKIVFFAIIGIVLILGAFSGGVLVGWALPESISSTFNISKPNVLKPLDNGGLLFGSNEEAEKNSELFAPFWESWQIIHDQYVDQPVDDVEMMRGAIRGMLDSLGDPHTSYMDPEVYKEQSTILQGKYEGIGAWVDITGDYLAIISPMPGSPAEKAQLKPGDMVVAVDGEDMTGKDGNYVLSRILGPAGSEVVLSIQRESLPETFDVKLIRETIKVPSVYGELLEENIAYVQISTFGDNTSDELKSTLKELLVEEPIGIILDLRYNGGGIVDTAIEVISQFVVGNQVVMYDEFSKGERREFKSQRGGVAIDIPLVVLVNEGSASASEITAGAIQDLGRGLLVGTTTFGKGSEQFWIPLKNDQGAVRVTIARWLTPNGRQINESGLTPDYIVEISDEDIEAGVDAQLEKAVELLTGK